jgi:hypothetical protein
VAEVNDLAVLNQGTDHVDLFGGLMETPEEQQGRDAAELPNQEAEETIPSSQGGDPAETPAKPVDDPYLPEEGDPEDFDEEEIDEADFETEEAAQRDDTIDNQEEAEEPNDLSGIDKEFEDEDD